MNIKNKGFTLIELLVVVAIISMLTSVVLSSLGDARKRAKDTATLESLKQVKNALNLYATDMGGFPLATSSLLSKYISSINPELSYYPVMANGTTTCSSAPCPSYHLLAWQTSDSETLKTWLGAVNYCKSLGSGSRLPTIEELVAPLNAGSFGVFKYYWSSNEIDTLRSYSAAKIGSGVTVSSDIKDVSKYVRCVR
jgi:prepilin-type N-terminal cleavage/methylation domain-containing protein